MSRIDDIKEESAFIRWEESEGILKIVQHNSVVVLSMANFLEKIKKRIVLCTRTIRNRSRAKYGLRITDPHSKTERSNEKYKIRSPEVPDYFYIIIKKKKKMLEPR